MLMMLALPLASCGDDEPPFDADMIDGPEGIYQAKVIVSDDNGYVRVTILKAPEEAQKRFEEQGYPLLFPILNDGLRFKKDDFRDMEIADGQTVEFILRKVKKDEPPMINNLQVNIWIGIVEPIN